MNLIRIFKSFFVSDHKLKSNELRVVSEVYTTNNDDSPQALMHKYLRNYLQSENDELKRKSMDSIRSVFESISSKKSYYDYFKLAGITISDIEQIRKNSIQADCILLMKIASMNYDGYVREEALITLGNYNQADVLPFIFYRLSDWVENIRKKSVDILESYKNEENVIFLIENSYLIGWLRKVERAESIAVYNDLFDYIVFEGGNKVFKNFKNLDSKSRMILSEEFLKRKINNGVKGLLINDNYYLVRLQLIKYYDFLTDDEKLRLFTDKSRRVKHQSLLKFSGEIDIDNLLYQGLTDKSQNIRYLSRFYLKKRKEAYMSLYIDNLERGFNVSGSILGLSDLGYKSDLSIIENYLSSSNNNEVKSALYFLSDHDSDEANKFAIKKFKDQDFDFMKPVIRFLSKNSNEELFRIIDKEFENFSVRMKLYSLKLLSRIGRFDNLRFYLRALQYEDLKVRQLAKKYIYNWVKSTTNMYHTFESNDIVHLRSLIEDSKRYLNSINDTDENFSKKMNELEFYF